MSAVPNLLLLFLCLFSVLIQRVQAKELSLHKPVDEYLKLDDYGFPALEKCFGSNYMCYLKYYGFYYINDNMTAIDALGYYVESAGTEVIIASTERGHNQVPINTFNCTEYSLYIKANYEQEYIDSIDYCAFM